NMGLDEIVVRDLVREPHRRDEILGSAVVLKFLAALVLLVLVFGGTFVNHMSMETTAMVMIIAGSELLKPAWVVDYYFQSQVQAKRAAQVNILQTTASCIYKLMLCWFHAPLMWFAWSQLVEMLMYVVTAFIYYERYGAGVRLWRSTM